MEVFQSIRGVKCTVFKDYCYSLHRSVTKKAYWRCSFRERFACHARIVTDDQVTKVTKESKVPHSHEPINPKEVQVKYFPPKPKSPEELADHEKPAKLLRSSIKPPSIFDKFKAIIMFESGRDTDQHLIILANRKDLALLDVEEWLVDFRLATPDCKFKLVTIHTKMKNQSYEVMLLGLMTERSNDMFDTFLTEVRNLNPEASPKVIIIDFDTMAMAAVQKAYPGSTIRGSFFHFSRVLMQQINRFGLVKLMSQDEDLHLALTTFLALAFLSQEHLSPIFQDYKRQFLDTYLIEECEDFAYFVEQTFVSGPLHRSNKRPVFGSNLWSQFKMSLGPTKDPIQSFHDTFQPLMSHPDTTLESLLTKIQETLPDSENRANVTMVEGDDSRNQELVKMIESLQDNYEHFENKQKYLRRIAYLLVFVFDDVMVMQ